MFIVNKTFFLFLTSSFILIKSSNLRKSDEITIPDIDILLTGLPTSYSILQKELKSQKCPLKKELSIPFIKELESNSNIKYYLNKEPKDFDSIIKDIIISMGISNPQHAYVIDIFKDKISEDKEYFHTNKWVNFNIITTVRNEEDTISFGSVFSTLNEGKFNFIFCYGYTNFKAEFNANNLVFLGSKGDFRYIATLKCSNYLSKELNFHDATYLVDFMNLVGFKVFGNKYNLELPYPNLD